jgi:SAM-dependent methyltransferase
VSEPTRQDQCDAAQAYESLFVPALFKQWTPKVIAAAGIKPGQRVLDVACGTGILARDIAAQISSPGHVVGIDPGPGMVAIARRLAPAIEWREGIAESLPFPDQSFEAVVSQFGLMFFTDRRQALREMLRVMAPGGRLAVLVWDSLDTMPAYAAEVALLEQTAGRPAADALRAPFVLGHRDSLATLFSEAGMASAGISTHHGTARFPSIRAMVEADLRGWLPLMGIILTEDQIGRILQESIQALSPYAAADGRTAFHLSAHLVTATKPWELRTLRGTP